MEPTRNNPTTGNEKQKHEVQTYVLNGFSDGDAKRVKRNKNEGWQVGESSWIRRRDRLREKKIIKAEKMINDENIKN